MHLLENQGQGQERRIPLNNRTAHHRGTKGDSATVLHWNGISWAPVTIPGLPAAVSLAAVDALSRSNVWAAGIADAGTSNSPETTLLVHWNGTAWTRVASPGSFSYPLFPAVTGLSMDSASDGWAVGYVADNDTGANTGLAEGATAAGGNSIKISPNGYIVGGCAPRGSVCAWNITDRGDATPRWRIPVQQIAGVGLAGQLTLDPIHRELIVPNGGRNVVMTFSWPEIFE